MNKYFVRVLFVLGVISANGNVYGDSYQEADSSMEKLKQHVNDLRDLKTSTVSFKGIDSTDPLLTFEVTELFPAGNVKETTREVEMFFDEFIDEFSGEMYEFGYHIELYLAGIKSGLSTDDKKAAVAEKCQEVKNIINDITALLKEGGEVVSDIAKTNAIKTAVNEKLGYLRDLKNSVSSFKRVDSPASADSKEPLLSFSDISGTAETFKDFSDNVFDFCYHFELFVAGVQHGAAADAEEDVTQTCDKFSEKLNAFYGDVDDLYYVAFPEEKEVEEEAGELTSLFD